MRLITVTDRMQRNYRYECVAPVGRNFDPEFKPDLTPAEMLRLGVFGGKYMTDCGDEFPASWFKRWRATEQLCRPMDDQAIRTSNGRATPRPGVIDLRQRL